MPQMSPMMWLAFPLVMFGFLVMVMVFLGVESSVGWDEDMISKSGSSVKW